MTVIQNTATDAGGTPMAFVGVRITLMTGTPNLPGYTASGDIIATFQTSTSQTGTWSINLTPNASITPANTYYQVTEGSGAVSNIVVPASGGPYSLSQVLVTTPPTPSAPGITGVQVAASGTVAGVRPEINLVGAGTVSIAAVDNPGSGRVDVTVTGSASAGSLLAANNLSDLQSASAARTNLGLAAGATAAAATTVQAGTAYGTASAIGTATTYAREDHQHGTVTLTSTAPAATEGIGQTAAVGTATTPARADHVHPMAAAGTPGTSAVGDTAATGVATTFAASDHKHAREAFAAPGSSAVGDTAAAGISTSVAHADHVHGREAFGTVTPLSAFGTASSSGIAATVSHSDHVHGAPALPAASTAASGIVRLDGTATDIQALGAQAAGSTGLAADAGHVHPTTGLVDTSSSQSIGGVKTFTGEVVVPTPANASDAATKAYVDSTAQGLSAKQSVVAATTTALPANTYANGTSGVGATLTATANGALAIDGYTVATGDRLLVKNEAAPANNGVYVATAAGGVSSAYVLTRTSDFNLATEIPGAFVFVEQGAVNAAAGFTCTTLAPVTIGTTAINWTQFSGAGEITAGTGLTKSGNTISLGAPVPVNLGGTGQATQQAAINALTGTQSAGKYLRSDGANATLAAIQAADLPAASTSTQGAVIIDGTAADIAALGTQAAGAIGRAADAGHVHPTTGLVDTTSSQSVGGAKTFTGPVVFNGGVQLTAGTPATGNLPVSDASGNLTLQSPDAVPQIHNNTVLAWMGA